MGGLGKLGEITRKNEICQDKWRPIRRENGEWMGGGGAGHAGKA